MIFVLFYLLMLFQTIIRNVNFSKAYRVEAIENIFCLKMIRILFSTIFGSLSINADLTAVHYSIVSPGVDNNITACKSFK